MDRGNKRPHGKAPKEDPRSSMSMDDYLMERKVQSLYFERITEDELAPKDSALKLALLGAAKNAKNASKKAAKKSATTLKKVGKQGISKTIVARKLTAPNTTKSRRKKRSKKLQIAKKQLFIGGGLALLVVLPLFVFVVLRPKALSKKTGSDAKVLGSKEERSNESTVSVPINQDPPFATLLPEGKTIADVGGFAKVSAAGSAGAYTYVDKIGDTEVQVTQQQLPESFKTNTSAEVEKMAVGFNATEAVKTATLEFFVGTSVKGAQSVITYKKGLLIFLRSNVKIANDKWSRYINDLQ